MANPFELLGLPATFALAAELLEQRQRELNRALHPDRHAGKTGTERRQALGRAMDINQAYRTLRDPASRAEALIEVLGADAHRERHVTDPILLGEMLEQREMLDTIRRNKDTERLAELKRRMLDRESRLVLKMEEAFQPLTSGPSEQARANLTTHLPAVRGLLTELRYVRRFVEEVAAIEDEI